VGALWHAGAPGAREAVRENLWHILGREPDPRQVREVFFHGALNYWDLLAIPRFTYAGLRQIVAVRGMEHVAEGRALGHGVILAGAHLSSVSLVGHIVPAYGHPMMSLLEPIEPPRLLEFFTRQRNGMGLRMLPASPAALREVILTLRRNEVVGVVSDRDVTGSGPMVQFFDAPTRFPDGLPSLALRTGAPLMIGIAVRKPDGLFEAIVDPPIVIERSGDLKADVVALTQAMARRLQYHVANHPEQWTVFQKRWPAGMARG